MIYGIIILLLFVLTSVHKYYVSRTPASFKQFLEKGVNRYNSVSKVSHYVGLGLNGILDLSILGYFIYALTQIQ